MWSQLMVENALAVARSRGACVLPAERGYLRLQGRDSLELLHRISTNDLLSLEVGKSRSTILCDEKGRVIDLVDVLHGGDSLLLALSAPQPDITRQWIAKFVISEDVQISAISSRLAEVWTIGPKAKTLCEHAEQLLRDSGHLVKSDDARTSTLRWTSEVGDITIWKMAWEPSLEMGTSYLSGSVFREIDVPVLNSDAYDVWRICSGLPGWGRELSLPYTPVEIGLRSLVSFTKGCYIGQEVISRIEAYRKVVRTPVGISAEEAHRFAEGNLLFVNGKESGTITSAARIAVHGRQCGIAISTASPGVHENTVVRDNDGNEIDVRLHSFPIIL